LRATASDLKDANPVGTTGIMFEFVFGHAGGEYFVRAVREATGEQHATFGQFVLPSNATHATGLPATFDVQGDTVTVVLASAAFASTDVPAFAAGQQITGLSVTTRRQLGVPLTPLGPSRGVVLQADTTDAGCPFSLGTATVAEPQPFPTRGESGPSDASIADGESFTVTGTTPTDTSGIPGVHGASCGGPGSPACLTYSVEVRPAGASTLFVSLQPSLESVVLDDFDVWVYDASGRVVASSAGPQTIEEALLGAALAVNGNAVYTIVVDPFNVPKDIDITMTAELVAG
jgi:hypothetical protein